MSTKRASQVQQDECIDSLKENQHEMQSTNSQTSEFKTHSSSTENRDDSSKREPTKVERDPYKDWFHCTEFPATK